MVLFIKPKLFLLLNHYAASMNATWYTSVSLEDNILTPLILKISDRGMLNSATMKIEKLIDYLLQGSKNSN
jgi:hypothetical protein